MLSHECRKSHETELYDRLLVVYVSQTYHGLQAQNTFHGLDSRTVPQASWTIIFKMFKNYEL